MLDNALILTYVDDEQPTAPGDYFVIYGKPGIETRDYVKGLHRWDGEQWDQKNDTCNMLHDAYGFDIVYWYK